MKIERIKINNIPSIYVIIRTKDGNPIIMMKS